MALGLVGGDQAAVRAYIVELALASLARPPLEELGPLLQGAEVHSRSPTAAPKAC